VTKGADRNRRFHQGKCYVGARAKLVAKGANWSQRATSLPGYLCSVPEHQCMRARVRGCSQVVPMRGSCNQGQGKGLGVDVLGVAAG
jgi:hypothetical protein